MTNIDFGSSLIFINVFFPHCFSKLEFRRFSTVFEFRLSEVFTAFDTKLFSPRNYTFKHIITIIGSVELAVGQHTGQYTHRSILPFNPKLII